MENQQEIKKCPNCEMMKGRGEKIGSAEGAVLAFSVLMPTLLVIMMNLKDASMPWWANVLIYLLIAPPSLLVFKYYTSRFKEPDIKLEKREEIKEDADRQEGEKLSTQLSLPIIMLLIMGSTSLFLNYKTAKIAPLISISVMILVVAYIIFLIVKKSAHKKKFKVQIEAEIEKELETATECPNCNTFYRKAFKDGREKSLALGIGLWLFLAIGLIFGAKKELSHLSVAVLYYATIVPVGLIYAFTRKQAKEISQQQKIRFLLRIAGAIILGIILAYLSSKL